MKKIKLLEIIDDSSLTGAPVHFLTLLKGLNKKKFEIMAVCPPGPLTSELKKIKKIEVKEIPMRSKWDIGAIKKIRKIISNLKSRQTSGRPQASSLIVHCHGLRGGFLGRLACIGKEKYAPKVIYTEHLWTEEYKLKNPIFNFFQIAALGFLDLFTDYTICVSKAVAEFLIKKGITRPEKVAVIYNGIELERSKGIKGNKGSGGEIVIGFVGSLNRQKGLEFLIKAMPKVNSILKPQTPKLIIVGSGPLLSNLKNLVEKLNLKLVVKFKGFVKDLSPFYKSFSLFVLPSLSESFGQTALEAMSYGIPIVASSVGGLKEIVLDKKQGLLVPPKDSDQLASAIIKILKNPQKAQKMGQGAKKRAKEFSLKKMVKNTEKLYVQIAKT